MSNFEEKVFDSYDGNLPIFTEDILMMCLLYLMIMMIVNCFWNI